MLSCDGSPELLFTENESNAQHLWGQPNASPYVKDAFHTCVTTGDEMLVNPARVGTKAAAHYMLDVPAGGSQTVRLRLAAAAAAPKPFSEFDPIVKNRLAEADEFYDADRAAVTQRGSTPRSPSGAGRHAVEQAVLLLRSGEVAERAPQ